MNPVTLTLSRSFRSTVEATDNVKVCAAMFGIGLDESIEVALYQDLQVRIGPGRIVYVTGDSGAGKSTLLKDIAAAIKQDHSDQYMVVPKVGGKKGMPLLDQFDGRDMSYVGELLNFVGISEPFVYLRKPEELSDGQRYRFWLARMIHEARGLPDGVTAVIQIDEFLAFLDRETARNVAYQTRRVASRFGLCFVVATTHGDIGRDLQPNQTITLRLNLPPENKRVALAGL